MAWTRGSRRCSREAAAGRRRPLGSGAGHDAVVLAAAMPVGMLFVRSPGGLSHQPAESVTRPTPRRPSTPVRARPRTWPRERHSTSSSGGAFSKQGPEHEDRPSRSSL